MFKTFVINLDKDTERMQFMHTQLSGMGIEYQRVAAILGKEYTPTKDEYDENVALLKTGQALFPNELGCALSHKKVYEMIVANNIPLALIFEDDVLLPDNFNQIVTEQVKLQKKYHWEYLAFNYPVVGILWIKKWAISLIANFRKTKQQSIFKKISFILIGVIKVLYMIPLSLFEGWRNEYKCRKPGPVIFLRPMYLAGAYLVTLEGVKKLLELSNPIVYPADRIQNQARVKKGLAFRCYAPLLVAQQNRQFGSSILELSGEDLL